MKKTIIFFIWLLITSVVAKANDGRVMLQSGGKVFFFDSNKINDAIAAAQEGDTIDLAAGTLYNDYDDVLMNKNILLRGKTADSDISYTYLPYHSIIITSACRIEGIRISNSIKVTKEINELKITSCSFDYITFSADMPGMIIERSECRGSFSLDNLKSKNININNCNIKYIIGGSPEMRACTFRNCNICNLYDPNKDERWTHVDKFINCILGNFEYYAYGYEGGCNANAMVNCLFHLHYYENIINCYNYDNIADENKRRYLLYNYADSPCAYNKEQLLEKGFVGTDGTVVGSEGGAYPLTLTPINTSITKANISMDETTRKISADVEVKVE